MNYENSVIAAFLSNPGEINKYNLTVSDFEDMFLAKTFGAMTKLTANGVEIDLVVLANETGGDNDIGILADIQRNTSFALSNINFYAESIKEKSFSKKLKKQLSHFLDEIDKNKTTTEIISGIISELSKINLDDKKYNYDTNEMLKRSLNHIEIAYDQKMSGKLAGVPSGIKKLDKELGGFHKSDFIVVGARPAMGKTSMMLSCAYNAAKQGYKVGIISTEMSVTQLGVRLMSLASSVNASTMRDSSYTDNDWSRITSGTSILKDLPIFIYDKPSCKVSDIAMQARAWGIEHGLDIIFVDYLTRIRPDDSSENKTISVGNIATDLKTLARNMDIPVVVLAQLSRELEKRATKIPIMSDLRDSGVIEQEADQVLMLYRDIVYNSEAREDEANIVIEKNRHGATSCLKVGFNTKTMEWCDEVDYYS